MADFLDPQESGDAAKEAARSRWLAVVAFNGYRDEALSPAARRVGIALVTCMDATTRSCFPSETYLAAICNLHISAIKKAKVALRRVGLVEWTNPAGPRGKSIYTFDWAKLEEIAFEATSRAKAAAKSSNETRTGTNDGIGAVTARNGHVTADVTRDASISTQIAFNGTQAGLPKYPSGSAKVPPRVQELSTIYPITAQPYHGDAIAPPARDEVDFSNDDWKGSPDAGRPNTLARGQLDHFPALMSAFLAEPETMERLRRSTFDQQQHAAKILAMRGVEQARTVIMRGQERNPGNPAGKQGD